MASAPANLSEARVATDAPKGGVRALPGIVLGGILLIWVWHWNYNRLGDFYDYSIVTSSGGYLQHGLKPYRDFTTPLQSLTIYTCYAAELIFGHRYLSLAYGNLAAGLVFYLAMLRLLKNRLPPFLRLISALALCVATFFQHGVLWYNSLAMMLLVLITWCGAIIVRQRDIRGRTLGALCVLLFLSSMCKVNFHLLGLATAGGLLGLAFWEADAAARKRFKWVPALILLCGVVLGPSLEIIVNGTTPRDFFNEVLMTPAGRADSLTKLWNPALYFDKLLNAYPDNYSSGIYLLGAMLYGGCVYLVARNRARAGAQPKGDVRAGRKLRLFGTVTLAAGFLCGLMLTVTNMDTQMLTASYLPAGLIAVFIMFGDGMSGKQGDGFKHAIFLLSGFFLLAGGASSAMHSRIRYIEISHKPYQQPGNLSPVLRPYFDGVRLADFAESRLAKTVEFMEKNGLSTSPEKVYWGPGMEILGRVYWTNPKGRMPLWIQAGATVNDSDGPRITKEFEKNNYEWIVTTIWIKDVPPDFRDYITRNFAVVENDELVILRRRP